MSFLENENFKVKKYQGAIKFNYSYSKKYFDFDFEVSKIYSFRELEQKRIESSKCAQLNF